MSDEEDDEEYEPYTAYDYWDEVYEDTMEYLKYMMESPREEANRIFEEKLKSITEDKKDDSKLYRFFYNRGRSLDELAYCMMSLCDREELHH